MLKRAGIIAGLLVLVLVLPIVFMGALLVLSGDQPSPSDRALEEIPSELIGIYQAAAATCDGLDWTVLAAIHKVETGFGQGTVTSNKGAQGPMQFMPSTFERYGVDGDGNGKADIDNAADAIFSAANLLCANGAGDPAQLANAIWNYNHSQAYVNEVLTLAATYGVLGDPSGFAYAAPVDFLRNRRVVLTPNARADLEAGVVDARVVSLLAWISERHTLGVSVFKTAHSKYVAGTDRISNHFYGRAVDIFFVDGQPVNASNVAAKRLVLELALIDGPLRPDELGHPFSSVGFPWGFTDADHADHLHIGFDLS
jgi:hypothetical protein